MQSLPEPPNWMGGRLASATPTASTSVLLHPTGLTQPLLPQGDYIEGVFGAQGLLARALPGYRVRPQQIQMARAVDAAFRGFGRALIEAPTAVGKSVAYGVPAAFHAAHSHRRVLIVTANIVLQEQLVRKDLPLLQRVLPWPFEFALLKGRSNYLCRNEAATELSKNRGAVTHNIVQIRRWAEATIAGDVSELPFQPEPYEWSRFSVSGDDCARNECSFFDTCHAEIAKARAASAQIVVTNYHLLFAHLKVTQGGTQGGPLPPFDCVILDEGHRAASIARDFFGFDVNETAIRALAKPLTDILADDTRAALEATAKDFFRQLAAHKRSREYKARIRRPNAVDSVPLDQALIQANERYTEAAAAEPHAESRFQLKNLAEKCTTARGRIMSATRLDPTSWAYYIETDSKFHASLCGRPVDVSSALKGLLFDRMKTSVITSATLSAGNGFDFIKRELGFAASQEIAVSSPLDLPRQVRVIIPSNMPDPKSPMFADAVVSAFREAVGRAQGRTLGLFTSHKMLDYVHKHMADCPWRVLKQGDMPKGRLIEEFARDRQSVLLGTESFWTGVDVQGDSLSCLVIDKLPFIPPDDPILDAWEATYGPSFFNFSVPRAVISFKQGFGRLIRSDTDKGVVVMLDHRIRTKPYGPRFFLSWLPPGVQFCDSLADISTFLPPP